MTNSDWDVKMRISVIGIRAAPSNYDVVKMSHHEDEIEATKTGIHAIRSSRLS